MAWPQALRSLLPGRGRNSPIQTTSTDSLLGLSPAGASAEVLIGANNEALIGTIDEVLIGADETQPARAGRPASAELAHINGASMPQQDALILDGGEDLRPAISGEQDSAFTSAGGEGASAAISASASRNYAEVLDVLKAQLQSVIEQTGGAVGDIVERLGGLDRHVGQMIEEMSGRAGESDTLLSRAQEVVASNAALTGQINSHLTTRSAQMRAGMEQDRGGFRKVLDDARAMGAHVGSVKDIARRTHVLSLNARIQAARAGEAGREFDVVAAEVRRLAEESAQSAEKIVGAIKQITHDIEERLGASLTHREDEGRKETAALNEIARGLSDFGDRNGDLSREHTQLLEQVARRNGELSMMIMEMMAGVQFQDITRQKIEHVINALEAMRGEMLKLSGAAGDTPAGEQPGGLSVSDLLGGYVMEEQRAIHAGLTGQAAEEPAGGGLKIELF